MAGTASVPYKAELGGFTSTPTTAFQNMSAGIMGGTIGANRYTNPNDPYLQFLGATDTIAKNSAFQNIYRGLASQAAPSGTKYGNMWDYVQSLLRSTNFSSGKTATGIIDPADVTALEKAVGGAIATNATDVVGYLQAIAASGGRGGTAIKQPDTTTKYNKQVSTALQLKDIGDATFEFGTAYMAAWGTAPSEAVIKKFQDAWNAEVKAQTPTTTSEQVIKLNEKVIDPKTGKQVRDSNNMLQYKPVTTTTTTTTGEGFTTAEQQAFLAAQLVSNFPNQGFDEKTIGGAAKAIYDELVATNRNNYNTSPKFSDLLPVIKDIVGAKTPELGKDALEKYKSSVRNDAAVKYMSLAEDAANGIDANKYVGDLLDKLSVTLESPVDINDPLAIQLLNFQAPDGTYRKANEYEIGQAIMNDKRFQTTSAAINQAVNAGQALKSALGR